MARVKDLIGNLDVKVLNDLTDCSCASPSDGQILVYNGNNITWENETLSPDYSDISSNDTSTDVTGSELEELTDGSETTLHSHATVGTFVDRGDPSDYDFSLLSGLTANSTYNDVDCSSIVPSGAKAILFYAEISDDVTNTLMKLRKNGNSNVYNNTILRPQVANVTNSIDAIVACDSGRIIECFVSTGVASAGLIIKGWWT